MKPTHEQQLAIDYICNTPDSLTLIKAVAGAGKTSLLLALTLQLPHTHGLYLAYNSSIAKSSARKFPSTVECRTTHSLAYQATVKPLKLTIGFFNARSMKESMAYDDKLDFIDAYREFCLSRYTSFPDFVTSEGYPKIYSKLGTKYLKLMQNGTIDCTHEFYLKLFHVMLATNAVTYDPFDFIAIDEAGDLNEVTLEIFRLLPSSRKIAVGDPQQNIYTFNHTIDCFSVLDTEGTSFPLTQSFRVPNTIAPSIEKFCQTYLDPNMSFKGVNPPSGPIKSSAYLTRTNSALVSRMIELNQSGTPYNLVRKPKEIFKLPLLLIGMKHKGFIPYPEWRHLQADFDDWYLHPNLRNDFKSPLAYLMSIHGDDIALKLALRLVLTHGKHAIMQTYKDATNHQTKSQTLTLSTAHACKGEEFDEVTIASDLNEAVLDIVADFTSGTLTRSTLSDSQRETLNLYYVSVTRCCHTLYNATVLPS